MKPSATSPTSPTTSSISSAELSKAKPGQSRGRLHLPAQLPPRPCRRRLGSLKQLGLHTLIARPASRQRDLVVAMIVARVIDARSKLATARALNPESAISTLGQLLDLDAVNENELYAAMDWLIRRQRVSNSAWRDAI